MFYRIAYATLYLFGLHLDTGNHSKEGFSSSYCLHEREKGKRYMSCSSTICNLNEDGHNDIGQFSSCCRFPVGQSTSTGKHSSTNMMHR